MKKYVYKNIINGNCVIEVMFSGGITGYYSKTYINGIPFFGDMNEFTKIVGKFKV